MRVAARLFKADLSHLAHAVAIGAALVVLAPAVGYSQPTLKVSWVSGTGGDGNTCANPNEPCRSISAAFNKTVAGGLINVLPGEYGSGVVIITRAMRIQADPQAVISSTATTTNGNLTSQISVRAGPDDVVEIRGLTLRVPGGGSGIGFASGRALIVEGCTVSDINSTTRAPIEFAPESAASSGPSRLLVRDTTILGKKGSGGVIIRPINGVSVSAVFDNVTVAEGTFGIKADGSGQTTGQVDVEVRNSVAAHNSTNGFIAVADAGQAEVRFKITSSTAADNLAFGAVATGAKAFMIVGGSSLTKNGTGLAQLNGATVASYGNNEINFNTANTAGTITAIPLR